MSEPAVTATHKSPLTLADLPRPPGHSVLGWAAFWTMPDRARRGMAKLGERVVVDIPLMPTMLFTSSVDDAHEVFMDREAAFEFHEGLRRLSPHERVLGKRLLDAFGGEEHTVTRRLMMPAFRGKALRGYEETMVRAAQARLRTWPIGEPVRFIRLMKDLARDVIVSVVFGVTDPARRDALETALVGMDNAIDSPAMMGRYALSLVSRGKWLPFKALDEAIAAMDKVVHDEIAARRAAGHTTTAEDEAKDCLSIFLSIQRDADPTGFLDDAMIAAFMRLLLLGGYETTATTLAWTAERLARHPGVMAKVDQTLAVGDTSYLDAVIYEAMRVRPAVPITIRMTTKDCALSGLELPAGTLVVIYINAIQKRADLYAEADRFLPERFAGGRPDPRHWMPFGGGAHHCLGAEFSLLESRILLRTILQGHRFAVDTTRDEPQHQHRSVMTLPGKGATVTILRR